MNIYEHCPTAAGPRFALRPVQEADCIDLLQVYSDPAAVPLFNSDNCHGDDFHYTTPERMLQALRFWSWSYDNGWFVRWSVIDRETDRVIGTVELCSQNEKRGILRLDLRSDYEQERFIRDILSLLLPDAFSWIGCTQLLTKAVPAAEQRRKALSAWGFAPSMEPVVGGDGKCYGDYYALCSG